MDLAALIDREGEKKLENPAQTLEDTSPLRTPRTIGSRRASHAMDAGRSLP
jgi:hypothetical protein